MMPLMNEFLRPYITFQNIVLGRFGIAAVILCVFCIFIKKTMRISLSKDLLWAVASGAFLFAYAFAFLGAQSQYGVPISLTWTYSFLIITTSFGDAMKSFKAGTPINWGTVVRNSVSFIFLFVALVLSTRDYSVSVASAIESVFTTETFPWLAITSGIFFGVRILCVNNILDKKDIANPGKFVCEGKEPTVLMFEQATTALLTIILTIALAFIPKESLPQSMQFGNSAAASPANLWVVGGAMAILAVPSTVVANVYLFKGIGIIKNCGMVKTITSVEIVFGLILLSVASGILNAFPLAANLIIKQHITIYQIFSTVLIALSITIKANFIKVVSLHPLKKTGLFVERIFSYWL
jgi:hypothetical protein